MFVYEHTLSQSLRERESERERERKWYITPIRPEEE